MNQIKKYIERLKQLQSLYEVGQPQHNAFGIAIDEANEMLVKNCIKPAVMPRLFFVVEEAEDGVWEQITIGLSTYEEAKTYKDRWNGKHPNAFIVASLNEA